MNMFVVRVPEIEKLTSSIGERSFGDDQSVWSVDEYGDEYSYDEDAFGMSKSKNGSYGWSEDESNVFLRLVLW